MIFVLAMKTGQVFLNQRGKSYTNLQLISKVYNVKYNDCKYLWDSPFTNCQVEIVNGVKNIGVANTIAPYGIRNVDNVEIILPNAVEKLTVNQKMEVVIQ
jgi:hypothetical protein